MKNFNRGGRFGDRKSSGGFGRRDSSSQSFNRGASASGRPAMHQAVCADCGQSCEVPFKPSGDRPVLCSNCFKGKDGLDSRQSNRRDFSRPSFGDKRLFKAVCADCGQSCEVPFQPTSGKPVFCNNCFGKMDKTKNHDASRHDHHDHHNTDSQNISSEQFATLNSKLDKILQALNPVIFEPIIKKDNSKEIEKGKTIKSLKNRPELESKISSRNLKKKIVVTKAPPKKVTKKAKKK